MKFTLSWLKDYLDTDASLDAITTRLTALGIEVDGVESPGEKLGAFIVGYVTSAEQHPNADRLRVCQVDTGTETVQVVCGAPNARTGMKGVFAKAGLHIPGTGMDLKAGVIRGQASNGMLCSEREMGLSDEHDGIIELPADAPVGASYPEYAGLNDPVIEIGLTPDRADCAGVYGIARDLAAAGLGALKPLDVTPVPGGYESPISVSLQFDAGTASACPMFVGRHLRGVKNGPSPAWLQDRLRAIGLRPISALVDVTNFFSYAFARPLHVFDAAKLIGNIHARLATAGETLLALDDKEYALSTEMTVIADDAKAVAIGGIMGGEATGCQDDTTDVFLEVAYFDPVRTAHTGRTLGILSDARYRFERGVDTAFLPDACELATKMILELCGGEASAPVTAGTPPVWDRQYPLRADRCETLGGLPVPAERQVEILTALGFSVSPDGDAAYTVTPPSWRGDVIGEADLVEEVLRVIGFDEIPALPLRPASALGGAPAVDTRQRRELMAKRLLAGRGLLETVTWSFMAADDAAVFDAPNPALALINPISADLGVMRPSILGNLAKAAGRNLDRGYPDVALFELGPMFKGTKDAEQIRAIALLRSGQAVPRHWTGGTRPVDVFDAKADVIALLDELGGPTDRLQTTTDAPGYYHPGRSGVLRLGPTVVAQFGELHPAALKALDVKGPMVVAEIFLGAIPLKKGQGAARPLLKPSPLQPVGRDFAFLVDASVSAEKLERAIAGADKALITKAQVFDTYQGTGVPEGQKSLAVAVTLQPVKEALDEDALKALTQKVVASVLKHTGGTLRG